MAPKASQTKYEKKLEQLRSEINKHDLSLLAILKKRFSVVKKIAELKSQHKIAILQQSRWKAIIGHRVTIGLKLGLDEKFTKKIMNLIHHESIRVQQLIKNNHSHAKRKK